MIPVGKVGDVICLPDFCEFCKRHFLISEELEDHKCMIHYKELRKIIDEKMSEVLSEIPELEDK